MLALGLVLPALGNAEANILVPPVEHASAGAQAGPPPGISRAGGWALIIKARRASLIGAP